MKIFSLYQAIDLGRSVCKESAASKRWPTINGSWGRPNGPIRIRRNGITPFLNPSLAVMDFLSSANERNYDGPAIMAIHDFEYHFGFTDVTSKFPQVSC
jgi:hypothetical protein